jgi:serpin B
MAKPRSNAMSTLSRRRFLSGVCLTALSGLLAGCGIGASAAAEARSYKQRQRDPQTSSEDMRAFAAGHNAFGLAFYALLRDAGNLFFSPYSIAQALTMLSAGARGNTAQQMAQVLHSAFPQERLHPAANALDQALMGRGSGDDAFRLEIANSVWSQHDYTFRPEFLDVLAVNYGAGLRLLDFKTAPEPSRATINALIAQQTHDKIKDLMPAGSIGTDTRMVLANATYFNAKWVRSFQKRDTLDKPFILDDGGTVTVPLMHQTEYFRCTQTPDYQAVALPYRGGVSMLVLLPRAGGLADFEQRLSIDKLQAIQGELTDHYTALALPKFTYQSASISLRQALTRLGMADAFNSGADFSGMDGTRNLYLSDVYHQAMVRVDEEGTEAAAATGVVSIAASGPIPVTFTMIVDRPFIFGIQDDATGALLFMGRILNPQTGG